MTFTAKSNVIYRKMLSQTSLSNFTVPQYNAYVSTYVPAAQRFGKG